MNRESGLYLLEFTAAMAVLLPVALGAWGLVDYMQHEHRLHQEVHRMLHDVAVVPFRLESEAMGTRISVQHQAIEQELLRIVEETLTNLSTTIVTEGGGAIFVEGTFSEIRLNQVTGAPSGNLSVYAHIRRGSQGLTTYFNASSDLLTQSQRVFDETTPSGNLLWAVPIVDSNSQASDLQYAPSVIVLGLRVGVLPDKGLLRSFEAFLRNFGTEFLPFVQSSKVVTLRGDFEL